MSVLNKMHHDFRESQKDGPVLVESPNRSRSKKIIIVVFIGLLILSAIGFATLIFNKKQDTNKPLTVQMIDNQLTLQSKPEKAVKPLNTASPKGELTVVKKNVVQQIRPQSPAPTLATTVPEKKQITTAITIQNQDPVIIEAPLSSFADRTQNTSVREPQVVIETQSIDDDLVDKFTSIEKPGPSVLEIKDAQLTNAQLARIKLKEAQNAEEQGALNKAAEKRDQALRFDPSLNDIRKSLSLYFYGTGNVVKAKQLLQTGAVISPDYSEFNLMLSRIALKEGDAQKAYLYLNQHPPKVTGHIDYYVSYAILAQKFHKYEQSESLYRHLLSERPNNGRWLMSLAIAQDKQHKVTLAIANYQGALLQPDLSSKAKAYINQRIAYLEKKR